MQGKLTKTVTVPSRKEQHIVPANWGKSPLTQFLEDAQQNAHASFACLPDWVRALEAVDFALTEQASDFFHEIDEPRQIAASLFYRTFGTFRAACRLTLSGQAFETTILTRSILESALYAWACGHSEPHREAWKHRNDDDTCKKACKKSFGWTALKDELTKVDASLAERLNALYEQTIERGAHPNPSGVSLSSETEQVAENRFKVSTIFMHGEEGIRLTTGDLLSAMAMVYDLLDLTISYRLKILRIDERFDHARQQVLAAIKAFEQAR